MTKQIEHKNVYLNPKNGAQTSYPAWIDVEPMDFGDLVPPKQIVEPVQVDAIKLKLDVWYELSELKTLCECNSKIDLEQYAHSNGLTLEEGRPRINGSRVRRYKMV